MRLGRGPCPLCSNANAELHPARGKSGGLRAGWLAVKCLDCRGFLIEGALCEPDKIPPEARQEFSELARRQYRDDGSEMLQVSSDLIRGTR